MDTIETINRRLSDQFGEVENRQNFRVVWSEDQLEKRWTNYTNEGFELIHPEVRELPKYKQWVQNKYILEKLVVVPEVNDLTTKLSYEPLWVFETPDGNPVRPTWMGVKFIVQAVLNNIENAGNYKKYKDPDEGLKTKEQLEKKDDELKRLQEELFPNESDVGDALAYREGISVPSNYVSGKKVEIP